MSKQQSAVIEDLHLAIVTNPVSGLFHGASIEISRRPVGAIDSYLQQPPNKAMQPKKVRQLQSIISVLT